MKKYKFCVLEILAMMMILSLAFLGCDPNGDDEPTSKPLNLKSLLQVVPSEIQIWGGEDDEHDVTVYKFNYEIKDDLIQAVEDAGFVRTRYAEENRDWDLERSVLSWCVEGDNHRGEYEIRFSAIEETTLHKFFYMLDQPNQNFDGSDVSIPKDISSLLHIAPYEIQNWGGGEDDPERDMMVYEFNPEIKDELIQSVKNAGFFETWSGDYERDWDLGRGVLRWCASPNAEKWDNEIQFSATDDTTVYNYGFRPLPIIPGNDGTPKTIKITDFSSQGGISYGQLDIFTESQLGGEPPSAVANIEEYNGETTISYELLIWGSQWGSNPIPWTGTGNFFIRIEGYPPLNDTSKDGAHYVYSDDGVNPTLVDIKSKITTLKWSDFIWLDDYTGG